MRLRSMTLLLAACALILACSDATAPDAGSTDEVLVDPLSTVDRAGGYDSFDWEYTSTWCHEDIFFEGVFTNYWQRVLTESGRWNYVANYSDVGTGTGLTSGAEYTWHMQGTFHQNLDLNDFAPWTEKETNTIKIIGEGSAPNIIGKYRFNVTLTPGGDLVVDRESFEIDCVG